MSAKRSAVKRCPKYVEYSPSETVTFYINYDAISLYAFVADRKRAYTHQVFPNLDKMNKFIEHFIKF